ncbi:MAG: polysaccharide biosynthesis protein [Bradyrhizobium sp.]|uniref:lipopolysaccharide biosynthesis protein n=1 Tax=Bradyrhizobium sp. TaxID=376 RepID=UPI0025B8AFFA|nr:polysaccharide biosynthesis protein [Bradyrhizobium sp.]MBI5265027.1 polysaccharide biosynthesis protein [Bradyrhizobium sp.]
MAMRASVMAAKFALAIFIARYLDLSSLGLYGLAAGAIAIVPVVVNVGMNHLVMRDAVAASPAELTNSLRYYWSFVTSIYVILLALAVPLTIALDTSALWIFVIAVMWFEHIGYDVFYLFSNTQRHVSANATVFLRGGAWILVYVPLAIWEPHLRTLSHLFGFWLAGGMLSLLLFAWMSWSWPWREAFSLPFKPGVVATAIRKSALFYVGDLGFVASQYLDRYLVTLFLGLKVAGIYFLFWTVANAATTFIGLVVQQQQRPLLINAYSVGGLAAHSQLAWRYMQTTVLATVALSIATGVVFQILLPWLGPPSIADQLPAFWLIIAGMAFRCLADFGAMSLFTAYRDRLTTLTNLVSVGVLAIAQTALVPFAGLYGAGGAILITFVGISLWRYLLVFDSSLVKPESTAAP